MPFDLTDIPVEYWSDYTELKDKLRKRLRDVSSALGFERAPSA